VGAEHDHASEALTLVSPTTDRDFTSMAALATELAAHHGDQYAPAPSALKRDYGDWYEARLSRAAAVHAALEADLSACASASSRTMPWGFNSISNSGATSSTWACRGDTVGAATASLNFQDGPEASGHFDRVRLTLVYRPGAAPGASRTNGPVRMQVRIRERSGSHRTRGVLAIDR
jgi:hypothetical protein